MDEATLLDFWSIPAPWHFQTAMQGVRNTTQMIDTRDGRCVLRVYRHERPLAQICYEIAILASLEALQPPFRVSVPLLTTGGERFAEIDGVVYTLSPLLSGKPPNPAALEQSFAAGQTLAHLVKALEVVKVPPDTVPLPPFGDLAAWAGTDTEPLALIHQLPLSGDEKAQLVQLVDNVQTAVPAFYRTMPQQITHRDYDASNVLLDPTRAAGVLDFEFCAPDLQIVDFAFALSQWAGYLPTEDTGWAVIEAFGRGYLGELPLSDTDIDALPLLFRLRAVTTLWQRLRRFQQGLIPRVALLHRIESTLTVDRWVQQHGEELKRRASGWRG